MTKNQFRAIYTLIVAIFLELAGMIMKDGVVMSLGGIAFLVASYYYNKGE